MTWQELKEKAKEMGWQICHYRKIKNELKECLCDDYIRFCEDGSISLDDDCGGSYTAYENISYDKMLMIMRGLQ